MTFTQTSGQFGELLEFSDNTIHGLGFSSEKELDEFKYQFLRLKAAGGTAVETQSWFSISNIQIPSPPTLHSGLETTGYLNPSVSVAIPPPQEYSTGNTSDDSLDERNRIDLMERHITILAETLQAREEEIKILKERNKRNNDPTRPITMVSILITSIPNYVSKWNTLKFYAII